MIDYSILIPQRDAAARLPDQLRGLQQALTPLDACCEFVCIDDGSRDESLAQLQRLQARHPQLRILRFDRPCGLSAALMAGVHAARAPRLLAMSAGEEFRCEQAPLLLKHLTRADFVQGKRPRRGWEKQWSRLTRIPRWLLVGLEVRDPCCLFWAAQREALVDLPLARGMHRYLATLVAARGYRVDQLLVDAQPAPAYPGERWPHPGDLLTAYWHARRHETNEAYEIFADSAAGASAFSRRKAA